MPNIYQPFALSVVGLWLVAACSLKPTTTTPASAPTATPNLVTQGREVFLRTCAQCHGQNAEGHVVEPAPALDHSEHAWHHPDQQIRDWIKNGKYGFVPMPALGDQLSAEEIEAVIAYLHTLWTPEQLETQQDITRRYGEP
jgi:mono/diheme cytochrome c family protein